MKSSWTSACLLLACCACSTGAKETAKEAAKDSVERRGLVWLSPAQERSAKLELQPVASHPIGGEVSTSGRLTFYDLRVSHVFSPVTGRVTRIAAEPGARVETGADLAEIESPDVGQAFSDLLKAQADLAATESELHRQTELVAAHAGAQRDLDAARSDYEKAKAERQRAGEKARLLSASRKPKGEAARYVLRTPIAGEVIARNVNPGSEVEGQYASGNAVELFTIGDLDPIVLIADIYEIDLARVKEGARVTIEVPAYPERHFEGKVSTISDQLDPVSRTAKLRCLIVNAKGELKPEMFASVSVAASERTALAIPPSALLHLSDQTLVFVLRERTRDGSMLFERRPVAVAEDEGGPFVPIKQGLVAGEQIVSSGAVLLSGLVQ